MKSLAVKYRPKTFDDVVAQDYVKTVLQNQLDTGEFKNGYLFCGGAGTGKTTTARIVANEMNKGKGAPIEIDGASNNGVDNIRDIIDQCKSKSLSGKYKVFIIDEVHMLSIGAFNALLKTLEEPPAGAIFILCTTDPQKIPATILSRVQRYDFKRIPFEQVVDRLLYIINEENNNSGDEITYELSAIQYIAKLADGGMRDAITKLDKVLDYSCNVTEEAVTEVLNAPNYEAFFDLLVAIQFKDVKDALAVIEETHMSGKDLKLFIRSFTNFMVDLIKYDLTKDIGITSIPVSYLDDINDSVKKGSLVELMDTMNNLSVGIKWETSPKPLVEGAMILACRKD